MNFEITWHPKAVKYVDKLPKHISVRILNKLDEVVLNPFRYLEHLKEKGISSG